MDEIMKILREQHGKDLTFKNGENYYLFFKDAMLNVCLGEDTKTLKVGVEFLTEDQTFVYSTDKPLPDLV